MNNKISNEDIENASVKLKPLFGIKPGIYLTVLYSIVILIILFSLLIAPGIKNNGVKVIADTLPSGAAVYVDDIYMGTTPTVFFTEKGVRSFKIEKEYFEKLEFNENIGGRIFGSLIIPRKFYIDNDIKLIDPDGFLKKRFKELSSYALIEDYYERYQLPPLLTRTVREFISGANSADSNLLYDFLYSMSVNLGSPAFVEEYVKAINLTKNGIEPSESNANFSIIFDYFRKENNSEGLFLSILKAYPENERMDVLENLSQTDDFSEKLNNIIFDLKSDKIISEPTLTGKTLRIGDLKFIGISSGSYISGHDIPLQTESFIKDSNLIAYPHVELTDNFYIMEKEITRNDYSLFLDENPNWKIENINKLIAGNLVSKDYLTSQDFTKESKPVANISWYAAKAYCEWLETQLPDSMSDFKIKLPSEAEWEAAARLEDSGIAKHIFKESGADSALSADFTRSGKSGVYDMLGNLWEWNENWVFPTDSVNGSFGLIGNKFEGVEKAVRGGSWANSEAEIAVSTRGSQDPSWCTPFLGFRPVMVKK